MHNLIATALRGSNPTVARRFRTVGFASIALVASFSTSTTTTLAMVTSTTVPSRMHISDVMKKTSDWLSGSKLVPIDFSPGVGDLVNEETEKLLDGPAAVAKNAGPRGSICFVVRRPGWVLCREHGQQLTKLAASDPTIKEGFGMFGIIKETGVDDQGLRVFQKDHFPFPLYRDENLDFYRAFGDAKITDSFSWWYLLNPIKIIKFFLGLREMSKRVKSKKLEGNMVGEGLKTGGIIVFGKDGEPKYAYTEVTGSPLETNDLLAAIKDVAGSSSGDKNNEL